jgi:K+-sensing histidine kinase KdpD
MLPDLIKGEKTMKRFRLNVTPQLLFECAQSVFVVWLLTAPMFLLGRRTLGESVIALLYLAAVAWCSSRWGQLPGICAALTATLTFNFLFIPPFFTFAVGSLEGWLVLSIFLCVSTLVVGRIQDSLTKARLSERDARLMYEFGMALAGLRTREAVLQTMARQIQQTFVAALVEVTVEGEIDSIPAVFKAPFDAYIAQAPDRVVPIQAPPGLIGEIHIWQGNGWLPPMDSRLLSDLAALAATALERARASELELRAATLAAISEK